MSSKEGLKVKLVFEGGRKEERGWGAQQGAGREGKPGREPMTSLKAAPAITPTDCYRSVMGAQDHQTIRFFSSWKI